MAVSACRADAPVEVDLNRNGSGRITVTAVADADAIARYPQLVEELRTTDLTDAGWQVDAPVTADDGSMSVSARHAFDTPDQATALLVEISGTDGPFHDLVISQDASRTRVSTMIDGTISVAGPQTFVDAEAAAVLGQTPLLHELDAQRVLFPDVFGLDLVVNVPGPIDETDGTALPFDDTTTSTRVRWTAPIGTGVGAAPEQSVHLRALLVDNEARRAARVRDFALWLIPTWLVFFFLVVLPIRYLISRRR
ncbi:MAG: hypothetical protein R2705_23120 [Ilumatobacteraceae bacterium]